jgi:GNAT superfamily N-acetyltransferase
MSFTLEQGYLPGVIGRIAELHARYYARSNGFGVAFEAKVARELAEFCARLDASRDRLWRVMDGEQIEGSLVIDGLHALDDGAHLRWFITSDALRGQGCGRRLLQQACAFVDAAGYAKTYLWTFAGLSAARHLYEEFGFRLVHQASGAQWGTQVEEQRFERLRP